VGIGKAQRLQHALDAAVLAPFAVQGVEDDVGLQFGQHLGQVSAGVDAGDLADLPFQGLGAHLPRAQGNLPFGRQPAHQDGDVQVCERAGHGRINSERAAGPS